MSLLSQAWQVRRNLLSLIYNDFSQNYFSSYLGFLWAIIMPLVSIAIMAIVFQVGFRVPPVDASGVPFVVWLTCGMICWQFFAEGLGRGVSAVSSYAFLVRKALFRISFLPPIRICTPLITHCCLMVFMLGVLAFFHIAPCIHWLQWFYYTGALFLLLVGIAFISSSLSIFIPDTNSLIGIGINIGFWATPVFWSPNMVPDQWRWLLHLNPVFYCVQGLRETFLFHRWFWERQLFEHALFWTWTLGTLLLGLLIFKKLRPYFADEL